MSSSSDNTATPTEHISFLSPTVPSNPYQYIKYAVADPQHLRNIDRLRNINILRRRIQNALFAIICGSSTLPEPITVVVAQSLFHTSRNPRVHSCSATRVLGFFLER